MVEIKLYYFEARGSAEVSRLVLALAGKKYEDIRYKREEWPQHKSEMPFGQLPVLSYDGKMIGQSAAIACFLAREFGLYGKTSREAAVIDQVVHIFKDLVAAWMKEFSEQDPAKKEEIFKKLKEDDFPKYLGHFVKLLKDNPLGYTGFFVGKEITLADLYVYDLVFTLKKVKGFDAGALHPELQTLYDKVGENPRIKSYVATRQETAM